MGAWTKKTGSSGASSRFRTKKSPGLSVLGFFVFGYEGGSVVGRYGCAESVLYDRLQLLHPVKVRGLVVLFLLVVDLIAVNKHLQNAGDSGRNRNGNVSAAD